MNEGAADRVLPAGERHVRARRCFGAKTEGVPWRIPLGAVVASGVVPRQHR